MPPPPPPPPPHRGGRRSSSRGGIARGSHGVGSHQPRTSEVPAVVSSGGQWDFQDNTQSAHILTAF